MTVLVNRAAMITHNLRLRLWHRYHRRWWWPWLPWWAGLLLPVAVAVVTAWMVGGQGV